MTKGLTSKQKKIVKAKVEADLKDIPQAVVAQKLYPNQTPGAASVSMSRELKKANVQEAVQNALAKHGITIEAAIQPIADGLEATRSIPTGDGFVEGVDHTTRLKASGMALKLMGADKQEEKGNTFNFNFKGGASFDMGKYKK